MLVGKVETAVADIGAELRKARIARKRSIEDISRATKITPTQLRAIENEAFGKLPGGLFTRGFLRAYAREVGLDPEDLVQRYLSEFEPGAPPADGESSGAPEPERSSSVRAATVVDDESVRSRHIQVLQLCIIVLLVALYFAAMRRPKTQAAVEVKPVAPPAAVASRAETAVATNGTVATPQGPFTLELRPQGPCWVEATADGTRVIARLMDAGQRETVTVRDDVMLRVGDPAAFAFSVDGVPGRRVGEPGRPVWVRLDRRNLNTFLEPRP